MAFVKSDMMLFRMRLAHSREFLCRTWSSDNQLRSRPIKLSLQNRGANLFRPLNLVIPCRNRVIQWCCNSSHNDLKSDSRSVRSRSIVLYMSAVTIVVAGLSYAAVPLYRMFCQETGYGGETTKGHDAAKVENMKKVSNRLIKVTFNAETASNMSWKFMPQQSEIHVSPGETALAFYTATNPLNRPVIGIATYNVIPFEAGQYFNKIQCFCFEEQRLNPHEQVDMPVFFYIDPDYADDPKLENVDVITLSYTFFEAKEGISLPVPSYARQ